MEIGILHAILVIFSILFVVLYFKIRDIEKRIDDLEMSFLDDSCD